MGKESAKTEKKISVEYNLGVFANLVQHKTCPRLNSVKKMYSICWKIFLRTERKFTT